MVKEKKVQYSTNNAHKSLTSKNKLGNLSILMLVLSLVFWVIAWAYIVVKDPPIFRQVQLLAFEPILWMWLVVLTPVGLVSFWLAYKAISSKVKSSNKPFEVVMRLFFATLVTLMTLYVMYGVFFFFGAFFSLVK